MTGQSDRLDSWKEIAEYLGRDVRTAMRWSKSHGLPVRRVAGGKGRSVFAFTSEIDAWLAGRNDQASPAPEAAAPAPEPVPEHIEEAARKPRRLLTAAAAALVLLTTAAAVMSLTRAHSLDASSMRASGNAEGISIVDAGGAARLLHPFAANTLSPITEGSPPLIASLSPGGRPGVLAGVAYYESRETKLPKSGELLYLDLDGRVNWRSAGRYSLRYPKETFDDVFVLADWHLSPAAPDAARRIATSWHEWMWWASPITVFDHTGRMSAPFVNPGWVESLRWLDDRRILAGGFNNPRDAAAVMVLDTGRMNGQAPGTRGTDYECLSCGPDAPLFYATLPRSELNRATGSRFNRAQVEIAGDRITVTTIEIPAESEPATAVYEFTLDMKFLRARYSVSYWDWHRKLEEEGRVKHARDVCPEKNGPLSIHVWDPARNNFVSHLQ